jgi:16S rRNA (uracil1498-N3)-methyltransferase
MRRRFFVENFDDGRAVVRGESAGHLARVLRAERGQVYELSDGREIWTARVERASSNEVNFELLERSDPGALAAAIPEITLYISIVKFDRLEWCLEKATEMGAAAIVPLAAARSEKALAQASAKRAERWRKILYEAAQQSRRMRPPELRAVLSPAAAFEECRANLRILCSEDRNAPPIREALEGGGSPIRSAALAFGPEGGWTADEVKAAEAAGFLAASLGPTILKTETAVIAALAIMQYALGGGEAVK